MELGRADIVIDVDILLLIELVVVKVARILKLDEVDKELSDEVRVGELELDMVPVLESEVDVAEELPTEDIEGRSLDRLLDELLDELAEEGDDELLDDRLLPLELSDRLLDDELLEVEEPDIGSMSETVLDEDGVEKLLEEVLEELDDEEDGALLDDEALLL